ncbi:MAG: hypothetical protein H0T95_02720 [Chthoniobacterales bacterium]|nr:hypothetical protein [Chthoniobacterales bacterium]
MIKTFSEPEADFVFLPHDTEWTQIADDHCGKRTATIIRSFVPRAADIPAEDVDREGGLLTSTLSFEFSTSLLIMMRRPLSFRTSDIKEPSKHQWILQLLRPRSVSQLPSESVINAQGSLSLQRQCTRNRQTLRNSLNS